MAYLGALSALGILGTIEGILDECDLLGVEEARVILVQSLGIVGDLFDEGFIAGSAVHVRTREGLGTVQALCKPFDLFDLLVVILFGNQKLSLRCFPGVVKLVALDLVGLMILFELLDLLQALLAVLLGRRCHLLALLPQAITRALDGLVDKIIERFSGRGYTLASGFSFDFDGVHLKGQQSL